VPLAAILVLVSELLASRLRLPVLPPLLRPVLAGAALALALAYVVIAEPPSEKTFLYFQF
jgi:hypothetical protein